MTGDYGTAESGGFADQVDQYAPDVKREIARLTTELNTSTRGSKKTPAEQSQLEPVPTVGIIKEEKPRSGHAVSPEEYNTEEKEPKEYF